LLNIGASHAAGKCDRRCVRAKTRCNTSSTLGREMERRKYGRQDRRKKRASIHSEEEGLRNLAKGKTYRSRRAAPMGSPRGENHKTHNALATGKRRAEKSGRRSVGRQKKGQMIAHHARYGCQATIKRLSGESSTSKVSTAGSIKDTNFPRGSTTSANAEASIRKFRQAAAGCISEQ